MDKQTQMYVGLGVAAVAGYLIYNNYKKNHPAEKVIAPAPTGDVAPSVQKMTGFAGLTADSVVGDRKGMVGMDATMKQNSQVKDSRFSWGNSTFPTTTKSFSAQNEMIKDGSWANAEGDNIAPNFFNVHDSENSFRNR
jgi:hypothetical protein